MSSRFVYRICVGPLALLCVLSSLGCEGGGNRRPANVSVSGTVKFADGKPLATGMIVFYPTEDGEESATTAIQSNGNFAFSEDGGIAPGEYRVALAASENEEGEEQQPDGAAFSVPKKYLQAETSGWTATIKENGNEPLAFTITKKKK